MSFSVIVNVGTGWLYKKPGHYVEARYNTDRGAKIACTKLNKKYGDNGQWVVMSVELFNEMFPVKMVERTNMMSGKKYMEAENTPGFMSPASEAYWST